MGSPSYPATSPSSWFNVKLTYKTSDYRDFRLEHICMNAVAERESLDLNMLLEYRQGEIHKLFSFYRLPCDVLFVYISPQPLLLHSAAFASKKRTPLLSVPPMSFIRFFFFFTNFLLLLRVLSAQFAFYKWGRFLAFSSVFFYKNSPSKTVPIKTSIVKNLRQKFLKLKTFSYREIHPYVSLGYSSITDFA